MCKLKEAKGIIHGLLLVDRIRKDGLLRICMAVFYVSSLLEHADVM